MQKERVLITDHVHPGLPAGLTDLGYAVDEQPDITLDQVRKVIDGYHGLVINSKIRADRAMIEGATRLKFIARLGSGMEIIDREAAAENGVAVFGAPEGNSNAVAEHAHVALPDKPPSAGRSTGPTFLMAPGNESGMGGRRQNGGNCRDGAHRLCVCP